MKVATILAVIVLSAVIVWQRQNNFDVPEATQEPVVLSAEASPEPVASSSATPEASLPPSPSDSPQLSSPAPSPQAPSSDLDSYRYPSSTIVSSSSDTLMLESQDSSDTVTDWYQDKIQSQGLNTKSFVKTKTNGQVLNKLVAAGGSTKIEVEITQASDQSIVSIRVNLSN